MNEPEPDFFELDKNRLDVEWTKQPKLYWQTAEKLADARRQQDCRRRKIGTRGKLNYP